MYSPRSYLFQLDHRERMLHAAEGPIVGFAGYSFLHRWTAFTPKDWWDAPASTRSTSWFSKTWVINDSDYYEMMQVYLPKTSQKISH